MERTLDWKGNCGYDFCYLLHSIHTLGLALLIWIRGLNEVICKALAM